MIVRCRACYFDDVAYMLPVVGRSPAVEMVKCRLRAVTAQYEGRARFSPYSIFDEYIAMPLADYHNIG